MKAAFIGAGRVGRAMGIYLRRKRIPIAGYYSRTYLSAVTSANETESKAYATMEDLVREADLIAITTPDDDIIQVVNSLAELQILWQDKIVIHMSGVHSSEMLFSLQQKKTTTASLHPMYSFDEPHRAAEELEQAIFTLEGNGKRFQELISFLNQANLTWVEIATERKALYHTAASVLSNYLVALADIGLEMLARTGMDEKQAKELAAPLMRKTVNNIIQWGPERALTGPIVRGDTGTIQQHLNELHQQDSGWLEFYKIMAKHTVELAIRSGRLDRVKAERMKEVLKDHGK